MQPLTFISLFAGIGGMENMWYNAGIGGHMPNQYSYQTPFTEEELFDCYVNQGMTQTEIAEKFHTTQKVVWRAMRKLGIQPRVAAKRNQRGAANTSWKGGRVLQAKSAGDTRFSDGGYWYVRAPSHPNATKQGYVAEHILVATEQAGRPLAFGEVVHHKDMNKQNNGPDNLVICTRQQHREYHLQLELIGIQLYRAGIVTFGPNGYELSDRGKEVLNAC